MNNPVGDDKSYSLFNEVVIGSFAATRHGTDSNIRSIRRTCADELSTRVRVRPLGTAKATMRECDNNSSLTRSPHLFLRLAIPDYLL